MGHRTMDFVSHIRRGLSDGRALAESRMTSACVIERTTGQIIKNSAGDDVAEWVQVYPDPEWPTDHPHADGKCRVTDFNAHPSTPELVGQKITINQPRVLVPVSSPLVKVGDRITVLTCPENPVLAGSVFLVVAIRTKAQETNRNLLCDQVQSGTE